MKILIVSDLHLSPFINKEKRDYLYNLFNKFDKIIINGDFWDGRLMSFDSFIKSGWSHLFSLLKSKNTDYIFGNHDSSDLCDNRVYLFSNKQIKSETITVGKYTFFVTHGDLIYKPIDEKYRFLKSKIFNIPAWICRSTGQRLFGFNFYKYFPSSAYRNQSSLIRWAEHNLKNSFLVCGHTHLPVSDFKKSYYNCGFIMDGYSSYLTIQESGVNLFKERY